MEALRLLKQCRIRRATPVENTIADANTTKTIIASAISPEFSDGEAESYFDLEFPLTSDDNSNTNEEEEEEEEDEVLFSSEDFSDDDENDEELKFTLLSNDDDNVKLSPSNELIIARNSVHLESSTIFFEKELEDSSKSPVSSLKSTSKFQFLLLKLKKQKPGNVIVEKVENMEKIDEDNEVEEKPEKSGNSFFAVYKLKVEEMKLPLVSLFTRDSNCSKEKDGKVDDFDSNAVSDERKLSKEIVQKYMKMVKPLYVHLTKNYMGRIKLSGNLTFPKSIGTEDSTPEVVETKANQKQVNTSFNNLQAGLKIVKKHLGKSRSDSEVVTASTPGKVVVAGRRDDSMVQLQDGIQGAILHCKKSLSSCNSNGS